MKIKHKILVDSGKFEIENPAYSSLRYLCWASIIYNWLIVKQENLIHEIMFRIYKKNRTFEDVEAWMINSRRRKRFGIYLNGKKIEDDGSLTSYSYDIITGEIK